MADLPSARSKQDARVAAASAVMQELGWCPGEWDSPEAFDAEIAQMLDAADAVDASYDERFERAVYEASRQRLQELVRALDA